MIGNLLDIDSAGPVEGFVRMAGEYGPIFKMHFPNGVRVFVSGPELVDEVCDDSRFDKMVGGGLGNLRQGGRGRRAVHRVQPRARNWQRRTTSSARLQPRGDGGLPPDDAGRRRAADGPLGPPAGRRRAVDVAGDMTKLTLETIARTGFGHDFGSFERDPPHPFVTAMVGTLTYAQRLDPCRSGPS